MGVLFRKINLKQLYQETKENREMSFLDNRVIQASSSKKGNDGGYSKTGKGGRMQDISKAERTVTGLM